MMKKLVITYKDFIFRLDCSENNTHIEESYRVKKRKDMKEFLKTVKLELRGDEGYAIFKRSEASMIREWRVHNLFYSLGIAKERTRDVDLNTGQPWYASVLYFLLSPLYM